MSDPRGRKPIIPPLRTQFGRLTFLRVLSQRDPSSGAMLWQMRCVCGNEGAFNGGNVRAGNTRSCGCLRAEVDQAKSAAARSVSV